MWFMVDCQFWPRLGFGICNNSASWKDLESCLQRVYWQLVGRGGVRRSALVALRQLDKGFYGIGCPHQGVECLIAQLTKLMVHYGCRSGVGLQLQVSMEMMIIELGLSLQPLQESFCTYVKWVTNTWLKPVWEKVNRFNIKVEITTLAIQPPREGDQWFMQSMINAGVVTRPEELAIINRVQCYQQVLFISDVLDAKGLCLDWKYLKQRPFGDS